MNYVDAGYVIGIGGLFVYGVILTLRRRRWDRALKSSEKDQGAPPSAPAGNRD